MNLIHQPLLKVEIHNFHASSQQVTNQTVVKSNNLHPNSLKQNYALCFSVNKCKKPIFTGIGMALQLETLEFTDHCGIAI